MKSHWRKLKRGIALVITLVLLGGMFCVNTWAWDDAVDGVRLEFYGFRLPTNTDDTIPTNAVGQKDYENKAEILEIHYYKDGVAQSNTSPVEVGRWEYEMVVKDLGSYLSNIQIGEDAAYILAGFGCWWECTNINSGKYTFKTYYDVFEACHHLHTSEQAYESNDPGCDYDGYEKYGIVCQDCGELLEWTREETIPAYGHILDYLQKSDITFKWGKEYKSCKATAYCEECGSAVVKTCKVTYKITKKPTADTAGKATATAAVVYDDRTFKDTKTITLPALSQLKKGSKGWGVYFTSNGKLNTKAKGLYKDAKSGKWYLINKGLHDTKFVGLAKSAVNGKYYYAKGGTYVRTYTGLAKSLDNGKWYYASKGALNWDYTGLVKYGGKWHSVKKGAKVLFTGVVKNHANGAWYYCYKGIYTPNYTGLAKSITNGKLYYVYKGRVNWNYSGKARYGGRTYKVVKGVAQ